MVCELCRRSLGRLSVFARCFEARYKKGERDDNINKTHCFSLGVLWLFLGSSLVFYPRYIYKVLGKEILILGINYE